QELPPRADDLIGQQVLLHLVEADLKEVEDALMTAAKLAHYLFEQAVHFRLGEGHHAGNDFQDATLPGRVKRAKDNSGVRGLENDGSAINFHGKLRWWSQGNYPLVLPSPRHDGKPPGCRPSAPSPLGRAGKPASIRRPGFD